MYTSRILARAALLGAAIFSMPDLAAAQFGGFYIGVQGGGASQRVSTPSQEGYCFEEGTGVTCSITGSSAVTEAGIVDGDTTITSTTTASPGGVSTQGSLASTGTLAIAVTEYGASASDSGVEASSISIVDVGGVGNFGATSAASGAAGAGYQADLLGQVLTPAPVAFSDTDAGATGAVAAAGGLGLLNAAGGFGAAGDLSPTSQGAAAGTGAIALLPGGAGAGSIAGAINTAGGAAVGGFGVSGADDGAAGTGGLLVTAAATNDTAAFSYTGALSPSFAGQALGVFGDLGMADDFNALNAAIGAHLGYDHQFESGFVVGLGLVGSFTPGGTGSETSPDNGSGMSETAEVDLQFLGSARLRIGYVVDGGDPDTGTGGFMPFAFVGPSMARFDIDVTRSFDTPFGAATASGSFDENVFGVVAGAGVAARILKNMMLTMDVGYHHFDDKIETPVSSGGYSANRTLTIDGVFETNVGISFLFE